jgi:hypothetical protein
MRGILIILIIFISEKSTERHTRTQAHIHTQHTHSCFANFSIHSKICENSFSLNAEKIRKYEIMNNFFFFKQKLLL